MYFDSGSQGDDRRPSDDEILNNLVHVPVGHHYLVLYSDMQVLRKIYSTYVKAQIEANPNSVIVLLPYYDTTDKARQVLESRGINVRENERQGSLVIVDIESVITNPYFKGPDTEKLRAFTKEIESKSEGKTSKFCNISFTWRIS
jgi:hypothetical protein